MLKTPQNGVPHQNAPKIQNQRTILPNSKLKNTCFLKDFKIKLKKLKKVFNEKSQKLAFFDQKWQISSFFSQNISHKLVFSPN